jgi:hypothetical protein
MWCKSKVFFFNEKKKIKKKRRKISALLQLIKFEYINTPTNYFHNFLYHYQYDQIHIINLNL